MTPRADLAEAVCREMWKAWVRGGRCVACGKRASVWHRHDCHLAAWHAAAEAPRGWTVRSVPGGFGQPMWLGWHASPDHCPAWTIRREAVAVYPTLAAAREARALYTTGDGWRVCRVVKKKDGG